MKITVAYWHNPIKNCPYTHMEQFEYSPEKRGEILDTLLKMDLSAMIRPYPEGVIIWIDKGRFGQK